VTPGAKPGDAGVPVGAKQIEIIRGDGATASALIVDFTADSCLVAGNECALQRELVKRIEHTAAKLGPVV
jgi:hypothetical protein